MTDPELVHRAEQAYLGALLARQGRAGTGTAIAGDAGPGALGGLRPQDFADPVHQAVYAALAGQALPARHGLPAMYERLRGMLTRLLSARARAAAVYMGGLPGLCPDPANMAAYAAMVTEASQARARPGPSRSGVPARARTAAAARRQRTRDWPAPPSGSTAPAPAVARPASGRPTRPTPSRHRGQAARLTAWTGRPRGWPGRWVPKPVAGRTAYHRQPPRRPSARGKPAAPLSAAPCRSRCSLT